MTPERWQQVDEIFQAAIELDTAERAAFIGTSCAGDEELRREVESLIITDEQGLSFIDAPAVQFAAGLLTDAEPELREGQCIAQHKVISLLGSGGMGQVYLAEDTRLGRRIALKLLPVEFIRDPERLRRFQQEARAASALNHPNIITIHEIGHFEERHFIATEFIDGETLRQRMKESRLSVSDSLEIAIQICSALYAAHHAGIVHRDIKPENVMLRPDGYVKVLDFGLAKLTQDEQSGSLDGAAESVNLSSGLLMGTVKYMSPEQAQGLPVDQRSDLFSVGVVLYEMLTGHAPLKAANVRELITSILTDEPEPLATYLPDVSEELQRVICKSLSKEKAHRYQDAEELLVALKAIQEKRPPFFPYAKTWIQEHKAIGSVALAAFVITGVAGGFALRNLFKLRRLPFQNTSVTKVTNFGDAWWPTISPDGKYVAYAKIWGNEGPRKFSIWLKEVGSSSELELVPATVGMAGPPAFTPDGKYLSYGVQPNSVFVIPVSGGSPTKLPLKEASFVSFSPDGRRLAYLYNNLAEGKATLNIANSDGTDVRVIVTRQAPNYYRIIPGPQWSPDGKLIACVGNGNDDFQHVFEVNLDTGTERMLTTQKWRLVRGLTWLPNMDGFLLVAAEETSSILQIWHLNYPQGEARRITNDTVSYSGVALTADGKTLVTTKFDAPTSIWTMPATASDEKPLSVDISKARQINLTNYGGIALDEAPARLSWTRDDRILYMSEESGNADIWSMNADGTDRRQLTTDPHREREPVVSPDGRYIVFMSDNGGLETTWRMDIDGRNQRPVTDKRESKGADGRLHSTFSADSKWIYFSGWQTGRGTIWRIPVDGGEPTQVTTDFGFRPALSPDGKLLLYDEGGGEVFIAPAAGGRPIRSFETSGRAFWWTPDGRELTFLLRRDNVINLWAESIDGGPPRQLTNFTSDGIQMYGWSSDGAQLAVARTTTKSDVVMISEVE